MSELNPSVPVSKRPFFGGPFHKHHPLEERGWMDDLSPDLFSPSVKTGETHRISRPSLSYWQDAWMRLRKNRQAFVSLVIIASVLIFTAVGPFIWTTDPSAQELSRISEAPNFGKSALVLEEQKPYEEILLPDVPESPDADPATLEAPASLDVVDVASVQSVRLRWAPVKGAAGYSVYRATQKPVAASNLGVPIADIPGGNHVSYEDQFNLSPGTFYYSVVAKNRGEEAPAYALKVVTLTSGVSLAEAQEIDANAKIGQLVTLKAHPLGTDYLGRDLLARLVQGGRVSLFIGLFAPLIATLIGIFLGGVSGYFGGAIDGWIMRMTDFVMALPFLLFMILFKVVFGAQAGESGITAMLVAMVALSWTGPARLTRGQILQLRESEFVQAARLLGAKPSYLILRHLLPNTLGVILVSLTFSIPTAIFTEAFLSFIGMGVVPPTPSWGSMCNDGIQTFLTHPHEFIFPALIISVAVLAFNLLGDGLRDALDPKLRAR